MIFSLQLETRKIKNVIITSRASCPVPALFNDIRLGNLDQHQLQVFISTLVPEGEVLSIKDQLFQFSEGRGLNPLFATLAIDYLRQHGHLPGGYFEIIQNYLSSPRSKLPNAPTDEDFLRVCRLTAFACLEGSFNPHDISEDYLRGVLDVEANGSPFYDNGGAKLSSYNLAFYSFVMLTKLPQSFAHTSTPRKRKMRTSAASMPFLMNNWKKRGRSAAHRITHLESTCYWAIDANEWTPRLLWSLEIMVRRLHRVGALNAAHGHDVVGLLGRRLLLHLWELRFHRAFISTNRAEPTGSE